LTHTSALEASFLVTTTPIFVTLGGIWFLREREDGREWVGLLIALSGTLLLVFEPLLSGNGQLTELSIWGNTLIFLSNIATAAFYLLAKKHYQSVPKFFTTSISFWVGTVTFFLLGWWQLGGNLPNFLLQLQQDLAEPLVLWPSLYMAVFGSIIGFTVYMMGQNLIEASEASLFSYLQPMVYIPLSMLLFGDELRWGMVVAVGLIGLGVFWGETKPVRYKQSPHK